jgi:CRP-like cAMP-binding protein
MPVVARGVQSDDPETRSQALEALETVGDRNVLSVLLPLLEQREETDVVGEEAALERLSEDFDPWLSALARACLSRIASKDESVVGYPRIDVGDLASLAPVSNEHAEILSEMERMLILEGVGMFADLDPEDLLLIARQTSEVHFEAKEQIYRQGDQGGGLIIITRGEAIVSKIRLGKQVVVTTYGEGDPIGELTMLNNKVRSADVHAADEGLDGLAMTKLDLVSILEERSSVAMGMLRTLALRLSDQT